MAFSCLYFIGSVLLDQFLVIRRERESFCVLSTTTPAGFPVSCPGNSTATKVNATHVLLKTNDETNANFTMEYGKGKNGEVSHPTAAGCPYSSGLLEVGESLGGHYNQHYGTYAALVLAIILIICFIAFFIYKKYWEKRSQTQCNGNTVIFTKCSNKDDEENGQVTNGSGQMGHQGVEGGPPALLSADV